MQTKLYLPPWWSRIARLQPFCYFSKVGENIVIFQMGREDLVRQCKLEASNLSEDPQFDFGQKMLACTKLLFLKLFQR